MKIGVLYGCGDAPSALWLREDRPLSYLRTSEDATDRRPGQSFAKVATESRNTGLARRYAVVFREDRLEQRLSSMFESAPIRELFPAFAVAGAAGGVLTLLTLQQMELLAKTHAPMATESGPVRIAGSRVCVELTVDPWSPADDFEQGGVVKYQYRFGISRLEGVTPRTLVWPNGDRGGRGSGEYVASMSPDHYASLGEPSHVVIENAVDRGKYASARARADAGLGGLVPHLVERGYATHFVGLDRGVREVLGICDGEAAVIHPWKIPNLGRRMSASRSVYAHPSVPLRGDLEKPLCRLSAETMSAIGVRDGQHVTVEAIVRAAAGFECESIRLRAFTIDPAEAEQRRSWSSADAERGYVDCAEFHGVFPAYPTIYLDYFALRRLFGDRRVRVPAACPVVQVRPFVPTRVLDDASEFAWVGVIGLVAVFVQALKPGPLLIGAITVVLGLLLVGYRVIRTIR